MHKKGVSDLQKLLSIIPSDWGLFFRGVLQYGLWHFYPIFGVIMLGEITRILESGTLLEYKNMLIRYAVGLVALHLFIYCTKSIGWTELAPGYVKVIHRKYMKDFVFLDTNSIERIGTGRVISIIEKGFGSRGMFISMGLANIVALCITLTYFLYLFFQMGFLYAVGFIGIFAGGCTMSYFLNKKVLKARRKRVEAKNIYSKNLIRIIMSKAEMMQSWNQEVEMKRLDYPQDVSIQSNKNMNPYIHWMFYAPQIVIDITRLLIFLYLGFGYFRGEVDLVLLVTLGSAFVLLDKVLDSFVFFYKEIAKQFDIVKRMWELFENNTPVIPYNQGSTFKLKKGDIHMKDISFVYEEGDKEKTTGKALFSGLDLSIAGGKRTALVGVSGSGKSTLVKLIAGYLRPDSGAIIIDEQDLTKISLKSYYRHIGYLTQEPSVFDGSILDNLTYAINGEIDEKLLKKYIKLAKCEFIYDFPKGLETEIGERGIRLSGGQRQRLAIAKVFLKNPDIVILDEPTSALDSFSEESITEAMQNLFEGRTVIIIAHRLQTVKNADDIIVLDAGRVVERGSHESLVEQGGSYAKMLELQSGF